MYADGNLAIHIYLSNKIANIQNLCYNLKDKMSDKKIHQKQYEDSDENRGNKYKKQRLSEINNAIDFDDEDHEELYIELQRFLK